MLAHEELATLAAAAQQALQVVQALQAEFEALSDPHYAFEQHAPRLATCAFLLTCAADAARWEASAAKVQFERANKKEAANVPS